MLDHRPLSSMAHSLKEACCQTISTMNDRRAAAGAAAVSPCLNHERAAMPAMPMKNRVRAKPEWPLFTTRAAKTSEAATPPIEPTFNESVISMGFKSEPEALAKMLRPEMA